MQRGAGHLRDVLAADRKVDFDAVFDLAPGLLRQPQQRVRDALLYLLYRHLDHAGMGFLQPTADGLQRIGGERRKLRYQARPRCRRPCQHYAVVDGGCGRRIALQSDRHCNAEGFAGRDIAHHDPFSGRRGLAGAHMADVK